MMFLPLFTLLFINCCYAESGFFWHVTDFHYDPTYWTSQLSCNDVVAHPGKYGDYWCDSPWALVQDSIDNMARIKSDVDFIIWTGDNMAHIDDAHTSLDTNLGVLDNVTRALNSSFLGTPFYPCLGNHDYYPSDQAGSDIDLYSRMAEMWGGWIKDPAQIELFKKGGYYSALIRPNLRLLALNTVLYMQGDEVTANQTDPADQFKWIDSVLSTSRSRGEKVLITGHISPTFIVPSLVDWFQPRYHQPYVDLMTQYSDIIIAHHYGHDHADTFRVLQRSNGTGASAIFIAPSITPWRYRIPTETGAPHNPGIRLVEYDRVTGAHMNYHQYFINLTDSNRNGVTNWTELYDFQKTYHVSDMSVQSLLTIYKSMQTVGNELLLKFCDHMLVTNIPQNCTDAQQAGIWCGGQNTDIHDAKICVNEFIHRARRVDILSYFLNVLFDFFKDYL
ncbi:unnamed protein product [Lymnaea stagnalis]|uniref:Uncharacterized protein n=1 Tax=Lymnaea stagnalis TaxID=6523 RepID=A0AAV2HRE2_LYMST